jgi:hypothetical protein
LLQHWTNWRATLSASRHLSSNTATAQFSIVQPLCIVWFHPPTQPLLDYTKLKYLIIVQKVKDIKLEQTISLEQTCGY